MGTPIEPRSDVLDGWKAIADYLGKSVRTVQRWRRLYGLPVHSVSGRGGGNVFACVAEIEAWRRGSGGAASELDTKGTGNGPAPPGTEAGIPSRSPAWQRWWLVAAALVMVTAAAAVARLGWPAGQPAYWNIDGSYFVVFDGERRELWRHDFGAPLVAEMTHGSETVVPSPDLRRPPPAAPGSPDTVAFADLDADGTREVLVRPTGGHADSHELVCFDHRGKIRWTYQSNRTVHFGGQPYGVPDVRSVHVRRRAGQADEVYVVSKHESEFVSLVARLSADGRALSEYWSNGHVTMLAFARVAGRDVVMVGAPNNETKGASLAIFEGERVEGSAPAANPRYRCDDCPAGGPRHFLVFPRTRLTPPGGYPFVGWTSVSTTERTSVAVVHENVAAPVGGSRWLAVVHYQLDPSFRLTSAETLVDFQRLDSYYRDKGLLPRTPGTDDAATLWPVLRWNGHGYDRIDGSER